MKRNVAKKVARRKRRVLKRLEQAREFRFIRGLDSTSVIGANSIHYELLERVHAINHGGIGMMMKLARSTALITEIDRDIAAYTLVKTIGTFSEQLDIRSIAEYVDTQSKLDIVRALKIDFSQGYLFGKPAPDIGPAA